MKEIYFDNASTTCVCEAALAAAVQAMRCRYGNPSSLHAMGIEAERTVDDARRVIAESAGCDRGEVYFTSGGTESNNLALLGAADAKARKGRHIIVSALEHASVLEPLKALEKQGYEVSRIAPGPDGRVCTSEFEKCLRPDTVLVSCMLVNNELGTTGPVSELKALLRRSASQAILHCDAVQAFLKLPQPVCSAGADLITLSGHKLHAPKGIGVLIIRKGVRISPRLYGGGQEKALRPGTEAVPLIAAFGAAAAEAKKHLSLYTQKLPELKQYLLNGLRSIPCVQLVSEGDVPYIFSVALLGCKSETVLHFLAERGIFLSSGSACSKGRSSHVLTAMGLPPAVADAALRISLSRYNTKEDADALLNGLADASAKLMRRK